MYQALYRVWRPQTFEDVVGQEHVTKTLQNALLQQKTSHAYLFSGPRGTGKTSAAKILAKAVNCQKMPIAEPCNECPACLGIADGSIQDVIEIDAASNNGVEEIRDIRDKVKYAPTSVSYKVYIIDEVHMLSMGAFNALLKTLEEPPKHVIFILATTEPHKIPLTIISRCQRFDFKRITSQDLVNRMVHIASESELKYEEKALHVIAQAASGGMRDALSLLDQAISFSTDQVTVEDALTVTGSVSQNYLNKLVHAIHEKNVSESLSILEKLVLDGKDPIRFVEDLILYFRDLLLYQTAPNLEESLERAMLDDDFIELAKAIQPSQIYEYMDVLNKTQQDMKFSDHAKIYLEVCLVKLCQTKTETNINHLDGVQELLTKIDRLEKQVEDLKVNRPVLEEQPQAKSTKKPIRANRGFQANTRKIREILNEATRDNLNLIKSQWGNLLEQLNNRQMRSQAALLMDAEPAAASPTAFVIKFKYEIHCKMAMENTKFLEVTANLIEEITGKRLQFVGVPEPQWLEIREDFLQHQGQEQDQEGEETPDPLIQEAVNLVGEDLIEIKN
ncbi:DNA polymerase III subunit gamma/tau [Lederbergia galactosidilytica]|uniref:DNA-directed DNA polymerase n=1 Tax=Lederbergia galactosidilytica TaxID=217031 RepID=A0A177ZVV3_9BACI|nr:DNA polymerase III subunit gamma/tau [Lederbergia galactosidilytica]KRG12819.1 DNA polymerase III subunit gamma/tau [Virgibacillus soli]MBP1916885.1 DNA polymerase-3 subunit gamma/tau [Lederbergia galactosidilytica]OAK72031.1 DNA polymerase III subunit gamma/tau [Lederbergia galactosidilytica]